MMRSGNPTLSADVFTRAPSIAGQETMTIQGTVNKTMIMLFLVLLGASYTWEQFFRAAASGEAAGMTGWIMLGAIGGFITALVIIFKKTWAPFLAPIYSLMQGLFLGAVSATFEMQYPGIVMQAVSLTFGVLFALLMAYKSGLIKVTENFKLGIAAATGGIALVYVVSMVMGFFGKSIPMIHESGMVGIGFSLFVVVIASLNLVMDFDFIEHGAEAGAPKYMEWFGAFGLMVTLIWLYLEILRLLAKLQGRSRN